MALAELKKTWIKWEIVFNLSWLRLRGCLQHEGTISFSFIICIRVGHGSLGWYQNSTSRHSVLMGRRGLCIWRAHDKTVVAKDEGWTEPQRCSPRTWNILPVPGLCPAASPGPWWMRIPIGRVWYISHYKVHTVRTYVILTLLWQKFKNKYIPFTSQIWPGKNIHFKKLAVMPCKILISLQSIPFVRENGMVHA